MTTDRTEHVASRQPLAHLFTVPLDVVRRRVSNPKAEAYSPRSRRPRRVPAALVPAALKESRS